MNNAVCGKTIVKVRRRVDVPLVSDEQNIKKARSETLAKITNDSLGEPCVDPHVPQI